MVRFVALFFFISVTAFIGCDSNTPTSDPSPDEPEEVGEFIDDWTFKVYPKYPYSNFDVGEFRLWVPDNPSDLRAILVLLNFNNSNGLGLANSDSWQEFAKQERLGLVGVHLKNEDAPSLAADYSYAPNGSGLALLKAIDTLAYKHKLPKLKKLPFLLRGYSAGGSFSYSFATFRPERIIAFANIRGYPGSEAPPKSIPTLMLLGKNDSQGLNDAIISTVISRREKGANWSYATDPNTGHIGDLDIADQLARSFLSKALSKRLKNRSQALSPIPEKSGWLGNNNTNEIASFDSYEQSKAEASWLIDEEFAKKWKQYQKK